MAGPDRDPGGVATEPADREVSMPLSPREREILAGIEHQLGANDPALATTFQQTQLPGAPWTRFPVSIGHIAVLAVLLVVLAAHPLVVELGPLGVGALTVGLIVPWVAAAIRAAIRAPRPAGRSRRPARTGRDPS